MAQAPLEHGFAFDLLSLFQDLLSPAEVDVSGRQVAQADGGAEEVHLIGRQVQSAGLAGDQFVERLLARRLVIAAAVLTVVYNALGF